MRASSPLWRHRDFLNVWAAETISVLGAQFTMLAVPLAAVLMLDAGPAEMGILFAAEMLPFLLFGLVVGVWVDRMKRRPIMIVSDLGRCAVLAAIPLAWYFDQLSMPVLYVTAFAAGVFTVFFDVAYMSYLPSLVERGNLVDANSKLEASRSASGTVGPSIAGIVVEIVTAPFAVVVNSLTYLASAVFLFRVRKDEPEPEVKEHPSVASEVKGGVMLIANDGRLRAIAGCTATGNLFSSIMGAVLILYAVEVFGLGSIDLGIIFAVGGVGAVLGATMTDRVSKALGLGRSIAAGNFIAASGMMLMIVVVEDLSVVFFAAASFIAGFANTVYNIGQISLRQTITPDHQLGKMNASMRFMIWGTMPIGALIGGLLGESLGLTETMVIAVLGEMVAFLWIVFSPVIRISEIPKQAETPQG